LFVVKFQRAIMNHTPRCANTTVMGAAAARIAYSCGGGGGFVMLARQL